jgi:hypothetical protein
MTPLQAHQDKRFLIALKSAFKLYAIIHPSTNKQSANEWFNQCFKASKEKDMEKLRRLFNLPITNETTD